MPVQHLRLDKYYKGLLGLTKPEPMVALADAGAADFEEALNFADVPALAAVPAEPPAAIANGSGDVEGEGEEDQDNDQEQETEAEYVSDAGGGASADTAEPDSDGSSESADGGDSGSGNAAPPTLPPPPADPLAAPGAEEGQPRARGGRIQAPSYLWPDPAKGPVLMTWFKRAKAKNWAWQATCPCHEGARGQNCTRERSVLIGGDDADSPASIRLQLHLKMWLIVGATLSASKEEHMVLPLEVLTAAQLEHLDDTELAEEYNRLPQECILPRFVRDAPR